jgi:6-phosphogluconolactonase (cycloisomerase 2 family)
MLALLLAGAGTASGLVVYGPPRGVGGAGGCLRDVSRQNAGDLRCPGTAPGLVGAQALALSPDGRNLYVAAPGADAVLILSRNRATGAVRPPLRPSSRDCVQAPGSGRCRSVNGAMYGADALAVSRDGRFVYVGAAASAAVRAFARGPDGLLRPVAGTVHASAPARRGRGPRRPGAALRFSGCVQGNLLPGLPTACAGRQAGLSGVSALALSPDGRYLYAVSAGAMAGQDSIVTLARDPGSGALAPLRTGGCIQSRVAANCARSVSGLEGASGLLMSSDGRFVYVASPLSAQVVAFRRNRRTGVLMPIAEPGGCVSDSAGSRSSEDDPCAVTAGPLGGARSLALTPDGRELFVAASDPGAVIALRRDPATGKLGSIGAPPLCVQAVADAACPTPAAELRGANALALSHSGRVLYVAAPGANSLVEMLRDPVSGRVQLATAGSAVVEQANGPVALAVPGGGRGIYLAYPFDDAVGVLSG